MLCHQSKTVVGQMLRVCKYKNKNESCSNGKKRNYFYFQMTFKLWTQFESNQMFVLIAGKIQLNSGKRNQS